MDLKKLFVTLKEKLSSKKAQKPEIPEKGNGNMADDDIVNVTLTQVLDKIDEIEKDLTKISVILQSIIEKEGDISVPMKQDYICRHPQPGPWKSTID